MNLPALILVHLLYVEATLTKQRILPLSLQIDFAPSAETAHIIQNEQAYVSEVNLNHGTYHSNAYLMDSVSLSLHGSDTTICRTSSLAKTETMDDQNSENNEYTNENSNPFIFLFMNSTISMSHLSLDCGWRGTSVGRISSSRLTIDNCPIISNSESSPFVIHNGWDDSGSSIFFVDCSHCSIDKSSLLALVSLTPSHVTNQRHTDNSHDESSTLVSCSGLSLCDTHLSIGSGPLVALTSSTERSTGIRNKLETVLIGSRLVNMTSGEEKEALDGWRGSQKILGSSVTLSTNHLYGTTCIDMNLGGSLLCSNTSFSHCHSSLKPEYVDARTYTLQHKTGTDQQKFYFIETDDMTFRRCTFLSMTSSSQGAAIYLYRSHAGLTVSECSFSKCQATSAGGAINFGQLPEKNTPIEVTSSLFVDCTADRAAAIYIFIASACTITNVVFQNLVASSDDGALHVSRADVYSLSNCAFKQCVAEDCSSSGGGMTLHLIPTLTMDSVLFRECSADRGNDIYCSSGIGTILELTPRITNCDSTSEMPNVYLSSSSDSTLIPAVPDTSTASLVQIGSNPSADQTSSTIQMKVSENVDGKILVLVDNTDQHESPNDDSPPTIARLLTFDFSSSIDSVTQTVSFGEWEELQYESEYCVIGSSIAKTRLSFSSTIALTTPNPARIVQLVCSLGSGTDHCWLQLKGRTLPIGTYTVKLVGIDDFSFSVSFDGTTGTNTLNMFSSRHSERLFGSGSKLSFSTKYEVASVTFEGSSETVILDPPRLFFTTPAEQPRLTSVGPVSFKDDSTKDTILIPLVGVNLPNGEYVLKLLSSSSESISFQVIFNSDSTTVEVVVYSKNSSEIKLKFGMTYTVEELTSGATTYLIDQALSIEVPAEPKRIEEGRVTLNGAKDEATLRLKGRALTDGSYSLKLYSVSSELPSETSLSDSGELLVKVPISPLPSSILSFGETYTISSLKIGSESVIVNSNVKLVVPAYQLVITAKVHPNTINTTMTLGLTGICFKLDGFYTITLSPPFSLDMLFNSSTTASSPKMILGRADCLQHNTEYTIVSITRVGNDSDVILTNGPVSFTTPTFPVPLILHVNEKEGEDDAFCGASDDTCSTIDFAWSIPIVVSTGMSLDISNGGTGVPTLTVPSTASMGDKAGMVVVSDATFSIIDVTIQIESSDLSFVFLSASESTVILKEGSFDGTPLSVLSSNSESEEVCTWESGIVRVDNCNTTLTRMTFSSLSQGAIHMKKGSLSIGSSTFHNNSLNLVAFPSARRNIACSESGTITIGGATAEDGTEDPPQFWIWSNECSVSVDGQPVKSPLFVPTLSPSGSSSVLDRKKRELDVEISGTMLFPCGLSLEVFEMDSNGNEGQSLQIPLTPSTTTAFSETFIKLSIALSSLLSLSASKEWRGRLSFASSQSTLTSFPISPDALVQIPVSLSPSGSSDPTQCLSNGTPCLTVHVGWTAAMGLRTEKEEVKLTLRNTVEVGERIAIGSDVMVLTGETPTSTLSVDAGITSRVGSNCGVLTISGGLVELVSLRLSLSTSSQTTSSDSVFVVCGTGSFVSEKVRIVWSSTVPAQMGLVGLSDGFILLLQTKIDGVSFGENVVPVWGDDRKGVLEMVLTECVVRDTTTMNAPLVHFSSPLPHSSFSLSDCSFFQTNRVQTSSTTSPASLVYLDTANPSTSLTGCVFERSGTMNEAGTSTGPALSIHISSSPATLRLSNCLFIAQFSSASATAPLLTVDTEGITTIILQKCWIEIPSSSALWTPRSSGVAVLEWPRRVPFSASKSVGVEVVYKWSLPIVVRRQTVTNGCHLGKIIPRAPSPKISNMPIFD
ncbi:hypothetical protein BLNAU_16996 [Blattamonas nauphoetae]|uniref:Uncharacterized protein n=1 Tax=Blattamonas nauphoetae TaxID=2049346 RepID=A0ABQ9X8N7_9EUKA|nr:hypothetical protein BLNAU_16996 [Blattamonas nauphoetae]